MAYFGPFPSTTSSYAKDNSGNEYFGEAASGAKTVHSKWKIFKISYTGNNWVILFPVDITTGKASDAPKFSWDDVLTYTYQELGT